MEIDILQQTRYGLGYVIREAKTNYIRWHMSRALLLATSILSAAASMVFLFAQGVLPFSSNVETLENFLSWEFCLSMAFILTSTIGLHKTLVNPYVMFLGTTSLFLGGRFFAHIMGYVQPLFVEAHFGPIALPNEEALRLVSLVLGCYWAIHAGYFGFWSFRFDRATDQRVPKPTEFERSLYWPAMLLILVAVPLAVVGFGNQYYEMWEGEYLSLYTAKSEFSTRLIPLANYGLLLAMGLAFACGNGVIQLIAMAALGAFCLGYLGLGVRTAFLSFLLLGVWVLHKTVRPLRLATIALIPLALFVIAQSVWAFSVRASKNADGFSGRWNEMQKAISANELLRFAHYQSVSLLSIAVAAQVTEYPAAAYVQTFIPGFGALASIVKQPYDLSELYFSVHMSKAALTENFTKGETMGWSIVSDLMIFSWRYGIAFLMLSAIIGVGFASLVFNASQSSLWFGALALVYPKLMLLPRAGLYSIIPYLIVFFFLTMAWRLAGYHIMFMARRALYTIFPGRHI